jgi:hypothetical protein
MGGLSCNKKGAKNFKGASDSHCVVKCLLFIDALFLPAGLQAQP